MMRLVNFIERNFSGVNLWVPTRDTGIDFLVTDSRNQKTVSLQVKSSRDYPPKHLSSALQKSLRASGWWKINREKLAGSKADYWVLVLMGFERRSPDFVVIKPSDLLVKLESIHKNAQIIYSYLSVTTEGRCWETRGLTPEEQSAISQDQCANEARDFSRYLNDRSFINALN